MMLRHKNRPAIEPLKAAHVHSLTGGGGRGSPRSRGLMPAVQARTAAKIGAVFEAFCDRMHRWDRLLAATCTTPFP